MVTFWIILFTISWLLLLLSPLWITTNKDSQPYLLLLPLLTVILCYSINSLEQVKMNKFLVENDIMQYVIDPKTGETSLEFINKEK